MSVQHPVRVIFKLVPLLRLVNDDRFVSGAAGKLCAVWGPGYMFDFRFVTG